MAVSTIKFTGDGGTFSAAHTAGTAAIVRSSSASDTPTIYCVGVGTTAGEVEAQEAILGTGKLEWWTGADNVMISMDTLTYIQFSAPTVGTVTVLSNDGTAAQGDIRVDSQPSDGDTVLVGLTGNTRTYTFKTTPVSALQVKIGANTSETADNLASMINDASTGSSTPVDGTDWIGTGTAPADRNYYVSATSAANVVTLTDRLSCSRQLAWAITQGTGSTLTIRQPIGGADGTVLGTFAAGANSLSSSTGVLLDTEDEATVTYPNLITMSSDAVITRGKTFSLWISHAATSSLSLALKYQTSNDGTNWDDGSVAITTITTASGTERIDPPEHAERVRLVTTSNTIGSGLELNAKVIY